MNNETKIDVRVFSIRELKDWIFKGSEVGLTESLISNARAFALVNNPYVEDASPAIAVAFNEANQSIGYAAVMADRWNDDVIFWATTGYTAAQYRGKGIGTLVYGAMKEACRNRWWGSEAAPATLTINKKLGLDIYYYDRYYLSFEHSFSIKSCLRTWQVRRTNNRVLRNIQSATRLEVLRYIDDQTYAFITQHSEHNLFHRSQEMLNWIMQYPFKACAPADVASYSQYEFTCSLPQYSIYAFRILLGDKLIGFVMFRLSMGELTLLYIYKDNDYASEVYAALVKHILSQDLLRFRTFDKGLIDYYTQMGAVSMNTRSRIQKVPMSVPQEIKIDSSLIMQGGDGDMFC